MRQKRPRGLGHAVLCGAPHVVGQPFYVMLGDVILPNAKCLKRLKDVHDRYGASVLAVTPVDQNLVSRYGVIAGHEVEPGVWKLTDLVLEAGRQQGAEQPRHLRAVPADAEDHGDSAEDRARPWR